MSEVNTPRLMAAAKEFNIGTNTLIDFLVSKSFNADDLKPSTKLSEQMYRVLQSEFQGDKVAKQKAEQIDLPKGAGANEQKKKRDEEDLSIKKKEEKPKVETPAPAPPVEEKPAEVRPVEVPPVVEAPVVEEPVKEEKPVEKKNKDDKAEISNIEAPELEAPKVLDKIDLDAIDSSTRPKKSTKKKEEPKAAEAETPAAKAKTKEAEKPAPVPAPVVEAKKETPPAEPAPIAPPVITNIQAEKLTGPKILGKITLPVDSDTRPKKETADERHKRKRIPIQKKPGAPTQPGQNNNGQNGQVRGNRAIPDSRNQGGQNRPGQQTGTGNRFQRPATGTPARREDKVIDAKEIQEKLKQTQAKLAGSGGRGKSLKAKYRKAKREEMAEQQGAGGVEGNKLQVTEFISVSELAGLMEVSFADVISKCMNLGIMVSINQRLEADVIELVASEFNYEVEFIGVDDAAELEEEDEDDAE